MTAISFPSLLQKRDEGIAPSLSQGYAVLEIQTVLWATPTPLQTRWNSVPLYPSVAVLCSICKGLPCYLIWPPLRVAPVTPGSTCRFWQFSLGQVLRPSSVNQRVGNSSFSLTRLHLSSLSLQPAGLLSSLTEPLSGNLVLQVTLNTSLMLRRR